MWELQSTYIDLKSKYDQVWCSTITWSKIKITFSADSYLSLNMTNYKAIWLDDNAIHCEAQGEGSLWKTICFMWRQRRFWMTRWITANITSKKSFHPFQDQQFFVTKLASIRYLQKYFALWPMILFSRYVCPNSI